MVPYRLQICRDTFIAIIGLKETNGHFAQPWSPINPVAWPTLTLRYGIPALTPLMAWFLIRHSTKEFRNAPWIIGSALMAAGINILNLAISPAAGDSSAEILPAVRAAMTPMTPTESDAEARRKHALYGPTTDRLSYLGKAMLPAPGWNYTPTPVVAHWNDAAYWSVDGQWSDGNTSSRLGVSNHTRLFRLVTGIPAWEDESPTHRIIVSEGESWNSYGKLHIGLFDDRMRAAIAALIPDQYLQVWGTSVKATQSGWSRLSDLKRNNDLTFLLAIATMPGEANSTGFHQKSTLHLNAGVRLLRYAKPTIILRVPALTGGMAGTTSTVTTASPLRFSKAGNEQSISLYIGHVLRRAPIRRNFDPGWYFKNFTDEHATVLFNPVRHQAILLDDQNVRGDEDTGVEHMGASYRNLRGAVIDEAWLKDAETIVFSFTGDAPAILPVELTMPVPTHTGH